MLSDIISRHSEDITIVRNRENEAFEYNEEGEAIKLETLEETIQGNIQSPTQRDLESLPEGERLNRIIVVYTLERIELKDVVKDDYDYSVEALRPFRMNGRVAIKAICINQDENDNQ
jgi:hypothetical protein